MSSKNLFYHERNGKVLTSLAPHTEAKAREWYLYCQGKGIQILLTEGLRDIKTQQKYVKSGASKTLKSYHLVGQALDFVPCDAKGKINYNGYDKPEIVDAIKYAKKLGFEWGGDWKTFTDKPHLQYKYKGYGTDK